jgi:hypothetical protein
MTRYPRGLHLVDREKHATSSVPYSPKLALRPCTASYVILLADGQINLWPCTKISTMLGRGAIRSSSFKCLKQSSRLKLNPSCLPFTGPQWTIRRVFAEIPRHRKDATRIPTPQSSFDPKPQQPQQGVKPESVEKSKPAVPASKRDALLAEKMVSNAEQRKADWAIIKEMGKYLWPKDNLGTKVRVGISLALLVGAKVIVARPLCLCTVAHECICVGPQCADPVLFQDYRR